MKNATLLKRTHLKYINIIISKSFYKTLNLNCLLTNNDVFLTLFKILTHKSLVY